MRVTGERRRRIGERVQVCARGRRVGAWPGGDLDVEAQHPLDLRDELSQRPGDVPAQHAQLCRESGHPGVSGARVGGWRA